MIISRRKFLTFATKSIALGVIGGKGVLLDGNKSTLQIVPASSKSIGIDIPDFEKWMLSTLSKEVTPKK